MTTKKFTVCVRSLIYNHSKYINECLHGFMIQEVDFPVVFMLEDDASTDGTQEILRKFVTENFNVGDKYVARVINFEGATTTFAQHKTNTYFYVAYIQMKYNHYSKRQSRDAYIEEWESCASYNALCEGDDYWTDPHKLQKQVDFLESHNEYSMCVSNRQVLQLNGELYTDIHEKREFDLHDVLTGFIPHTQTVMYRNDEVCKQCFQKFCRGPQNDRMIGYVNAHAGKIYCLSDITAVYRQSGFGVWSNYSEEQKRILEIEDFYNFHKLIDFQYRSTYATEYARRCLDMIYYPIRHCRWNESVNPAIKLLFKHLTLTEVASETTKYLKSKLIRR